MFIFRKSYGKGFEEIELDANMRLGLAHTVSGLCLSRWAM